MPSKTNALLGYYITVWPGIMRETFIYQSFLITVDFSGNCFAGAMPSSVVLGRVYTITMYFLLQRDALLKYSKFALCKKASNHHANLPLEMYSFTL